MMSALKHALDKSEKKVPILDKRKWSIQRAQSKENGLYDEHSKSCLEWK